jgi:YbbR domain-containing protein
MKAILNNWLAKVLALVLAVILWAVIKKSLEPTTSPSRFQFDEMEKRFEDKFQFESSHYDNSKKK